MSYRDLVWADGASHYWQLNEPRGTLAVDQIGGANGTISGGVTLNQPGALADGDKAMAFDGTTGKVMTGASVAIGPTRSFEWWQKTTVGGSYFGIPLAGSNDRILVNTDASTTVALQIYHASIAQVSTPVASNLAVNLWDGNWHHLVLVFPGDTTMQIFVDGVSRVVSNLPLQQPLVNQTTVYQIGHHSDFARFWNGSIDDVAIYPVALTAAQIAAHYAAGAPAVPVTPPPIDSSEIDAALIAVLQNDATLKTLMPDGVFFGLAGPSLATGKNSTRFVLVSVMENVDRAVFGGRAIESILYLVQAVSLSGDSKGAAKRIDELLEDHPLTVAGYTFMSCAREQRIREMERDDVDPTIVWTHRGGMYRVEMSVDAASVAA